MLQATSHCQMLSLHRHKRCCKSLRVCEPLLCLRSILQLLLKWQLFCRDYAAEEKELGLVHNIRLTLACNFVVLHKTIAKVRQLPSRSSSRWRWSPVSVLEQEYSSCKRVHHPPVFTKQHADGMLCRAAQPCCLLTKRQKPPAKAALVQDPHTSGGADGTAGMLCRECLPCQNPKDIFVAGECFH